MEKNALTELEQLTLTSASKSFLKETAKWTFFLSILGFVGIAFMILFSFFAGTIFSAIPQAKQLPANFGFIMTITYLALALVYFFPVYYLFQFSNKLKLALISKSDEILAKSFEMLKSHYKFIGVFSVITLSLYLLMFVVSMLGVLA